MQKEGIEEESTGFVTYSEKGHRWAVSLVDFYTTHWVPCQNGCGTEAWLGPDNEEEPTLYDWVHVGFDIGATFGDERNLPTCSQMQMRKALK